MEQENIPGTEGTPTPEVQPDPSGQPSAEQEGSAKGKRGRKAGGKNKVKAETDRAPEPLRQERKDPDDIKDTASAIHASTERQRILVARHRIEHPETPVGDAVDPFDAPAREPIPPEMIRPALDVIVGLAAMLCKPLAEDIPTDEAMEKASVAWSKASVYLPLPSPSAIAITGASFCTLGLIAPMAISRLQGIYATAEGATLITGSAKEANRAGTVSPIRPEQDPAFSPGG